jgi:glycosyltransferase involved in cell wall biosynthesis
MYPPHHYGGYELSCRDVADRWRSRGHEVTVLTSRIRVRGVGATDERHVRRELEMYWDDHRLVSPPPWRRLAIERANRERLLRALDDTRPDVVSVWHMGCMSFGLLRELADAGTPVVYVVCDDWLDYGPLVDPWARPFLRHPRLGRIVERLVGVPVVLTDVGRSGTFCFVSDATRRRAIAAGRWTFPDSTVVYSGIDRGDFPASDDVDRPWQWRLLYVGRIDERKGLRTLVRALAQLPRGATLDVVGRGDDRHLDEVRALVRDLGLDARVRFSVRAREDLAAVYRSADVVVFPSEWDEPFGLVPVEAMACATPVVATGTGGSGEFLFDEVNCLRFRAGDPDSLAAAVSRLAGDASLRRRLIVGGTVTASDLDVDRLADVLDEWHQAAAARFTNGRPAHRRVPVVAAT